MKKQHRIVSLLLVFTLLFGSLIFTTGGTTAVAADSSNGTFTPTDTLESVSLGTGGALSFAFDANSDINTGVTVSNYENNYNGYKLTSSNGDTMLELVPVKTGEITGNCQFTLLGKTKNIAYESAKSQYTVYDFDVATESDLLDLYINPNMRNSLPVTDSEGKVNYDTGLWGGSNLSMRGMFSVNPGEFYHVTIVQDLTNNKQYIFLNNKLADSTSTVTDGYSEWKNGTVKYTNSIKIQSHASYGSNTCKLVLGQSIFFDNIGLENYSYDAGTTSLTEALAAGDLSLWTDNKFNSSYVLPTLPDLVEIDGVAYNNVATADTLLSWGGHTRTVELLRDSAVKLTVDMPVTLKTNSLTNYVQGERVTSTATNADGTISFTAPTNTNMLAADLTETNATEAMTLVKYPAGDNLLSSMAFNNGYFEATTRSAYKAVSITGHEYIVDQPTDGVDNTSTAGIWGSWAVGESKSKYVKGESQHLIIDVDISLSSYTERLYFEVQTRLVSSSNTSKYSFVKVNEIFSAHNVPLNQFVHLTAVGDVDDNLWHIFVNGKLLESVSYFYQDDVPDASSSDYYGLQGVRLSWCNGTQVNSDNFVSYDNVYIRLQSNTTMNTAVEKKDLSYFDNNVYGTYQMPLKDIKLIVDGTSYGSAANTEAVLSDGVSSYVVLENNIDEDINVAESAIIRTNGYTCNVVAADGYKASEPQAALNGGTLIIVTPNTGSSEDSIPAADSNISETMPTSSYDSSTYNLIKSSVSGNLLSGLSHNNYNKEYARVVYHITDTVTGNVIVRESTYDNFHRVTQAEDAATWQDSYINWNVSNYKTNAVYTAGTYLIVDADIALTTNDEMVLAFNTRQDITASSNPGLGGLTSVSVNSAFTAAGIGLNEYAHLTVLCDCNDGTAYTFVNGNYATTTAKAIHLNANNGAGNTDQALQSIRVGQNPGLNANFCYDNVSIRMSSDSSLADVITSKNFTGHSVNVYGTYEMPMLPVIASVDGVYYDNEAKLSAALMGGGHKNVEFYHQPSTAVSLDCDATINTNGFTNCIAPINGAAIIAQIGTTIYTSGEGNAAISETIETVDKEWFTLSGSYDDKSISGILSASEANPGSFKYYNVTDSNGNYYILQPKVDKTSVNTFIAVDFADLALTSTSYAVFQMDAATDSDVIDYISINTVTRGGSKTGDSDANITFTKYLSDVRKWARITVIYDFASNERHIFVNGIFVETISGAYNAGNVGENLEQYSLQSIRVNMSGSLAVSQDSSLYVDNFFFKGYSSDTANLEACISAGSLAQYTDDDNTSTRQGQNTLPIAIVDGVECSSIDEILVDGGTHAVYLLREPFGGFGTLTVGSNTTIAHNGFSVNVEGVPGYKVTTSSQNIFVESDSSEKKISLIVNGTEFKIRLENGADIKAYLEQYGSYFGDKNIFALNGKVYYDVVWDVTPGLVSGNKTYTATGTEYTGKFFVHKDGTQVSATEDSSGYYAIVKSDQGVHNIILADNFTVELTGDLFRATTNIYLNGYTLNHTSSSDCHGFNSATGAVIAFYGPGTIEDMQSSGTQGFIFGAQGNKGTLIMKNLSFNGTKAVSQLRDGYVTIDNCKINVIALHQGALINYGEKATAPMEINILNTDITFKMSDNSTSTPMIQETSNGLPHNINIKGCNIVSEVGLLGGSKWPSDATNDRINTTVNIDNTSIIAPMWYVNNSSFFAPELSQRVTIGNNVSVNSVLSTMTGDAHLAEGIEVVKSNNYQTPITYAKDYTTVILANGKTEKWAIGSTPVLPGSLAYVEKAEGGTQFLATGLTSAPFALKGNLSLGAEIAFNLYVPTDAPLVNITVNGVTYHSETVKLNGELVNAYRIPLTPVDAASAFDVIFNCGGYAVSQTLSVAKYASVIYATDSAEAKALMSATLAYIKGNLRYVGAVNSSWVGMDISEINALLNANPSTSVSVSGVTSTTDASGITASYLESAQLGLGSTIKFRFNLKDGVDGNAITVKVDGEVREATVTDNYIEIELKAHEMTKIISFETADVTTNNTYDIVAYLQTLINNSNASGDYTQRINYTFVTNSDMANLIYTYALKAADYQDSIAQ